MEQTRRGFMGLLAATVAVGGQTLEFTEEIPDETVHVRHDRHPFMPMVTVCFGWAAARDGRTYAHAVPYTAIDMERTSGRVAVDAEAHVRAKLTGPDRDLYMHHAYDQIPLQQPVASADGSYSWS